LKLLDGGVSPGDTIRNKQQQQQQQQQQTTNDKRQTTNHFLGGRNTRLIPF
jgi:hypothetical protein